MNEFKKISDKIDASIPEIEKLSSDLSLVAAQSAQVKMLSRTFSGNKGVLDVDGRPLSGYSTAWAKKREDAGLQTEKKDLIFNKNSSAIFDSLQVGISNGIPTLGFTKSKGADIAGYQEDQNNTKIWQLNKAERDEVVSDTREFVKERMREIIKSWH